MGRGLLLSGLTLIAILAMLLAMGACYLSFATNDYRPILAVALGLWLLGSICFAVLYWLDRKSRALILWLWAIPSALVWADLARRGPAVFFGW
jgi:hypothetical protein